MGFHVNCRGADLLHGLRASARALLGEPYSLYLIALATQVDDAALEWLHKYEMQLDSLTGPYAAFLMFYNRAYLSVTDDSSCPLPLDPAERALTSGDRARWPGDAVKIEIESSILNAGASAVDDALKYDHRVGTDKTVLVTSMTYESDTVARELGVVEALPCLIVFDNPASPEFYVFSLMESDADRMRDLRSLIGAFLADPNHSQYLEILRRWHNQNAKLQKLQAQRKQVLASQPRHADYIHAELRRAKEMLFAGQVSDFRKTVNLMEGKTGNIGRLPWKQLRTITNDISVALSLSRKILADSTRPAHLTAALARTRAITGANADKSTAPALLKEHVTRAADSAVEMILDSLLLGKAADLLAESIRQIEEAIIGETKALQHLDSILAPMPRPSLAPHVKALNREKRHKDLIKVTRRVLTEASSRLPSLLDAVQKGVHLFS
jgi:hypothetical protein